GRDASEHAADRGPLRFYGIGREIEHAGVRAPVRIQVEVPVREVVRLVPQHYGFNHELASGTRTLPLRDGRRFRNRRCAAWPPRRRGWESTSWWGRANSTAPRSTSPDIHRARRWRAHGMGSRDSV